MNLARFFEATTDLGALGTNYFLEIRTHIDDTWQSLRFQDAADAADAVKELRNKGDVYFGVCPRATSAHGFPTKNDIPGAKTLWADLDISKIPIDGALAWNEVKPKVLPPSFVVSTGHGLHLYWLLDEFARDVDRVEALNQEIAQAVPMADAVHDIGRIMRVPGTQNFKGPKPLSVRLIEATHDRTYRPGAVRGFFAVKEDVRLLLTSGDLHGYDSRSERDWAVLTALATQRVAYEDVEALFKALPVGDKYREDGPRYLQYSYEKASERAVRVRALTEWGLTEGAGGYWKQGRGKEAALVRVSTFVFRVRQVLEGPDQDVLVGDIHASGRIWPRIQLPRNAFSNVMALLRHLPTAEWQWIGTDNDVRRFLPMLLDNLPEGAQTKVRATYSLGWHKDTWVGTTQTVDSEGSEIPPGKAPVVFVDPHREAPHVRYENIGKPADQEVLRAVEEVNEFGVLWPILSWYLATFFKPRLEDEHDLRFPILHLYGTRGCGKSTTLQRIMLPLVGITNPVAYNCSTTNFVLLSLLGSSNAIPVSLTEFRHSTLQPADFARILRLLLMAYDSGADARGRADQTTRTYPLTAPVTLDGEDLIGDAAMHERVIAVNMRPAAILPGTAFSNAFYSLNRSALRAQSGPILTHSLQQDLEELVAQARAVTREALKDVILPDRVLNNHIVLGVGALSYLRLTHRGELFKPEFMARVCAQTVENVVSRGLGRTRLLVDDMIEDILAAAAQRSAQFHYRYEPEVNVLWVHLSSAMGWWLAKRRREGRPALGTAAVKAQLRERSQELGEADDPGLYITERKGKSIGGSLMWCYGIALETCLEAGLDVPDRLDMSQVTLNL